MELHAHRAMETCFDRSSMTGTRTLQLGGNPWPPKFDATGMDQFHPSCSRTRQVICVPRIENKPRTRRSQRSVPIVTQARRHQPQNSLNSSSVADPPPHQWAGAEPTFVCPALVGRCDSEFNYRSDANQREKRFGRSLSANFQSMFTGLGGIIITVSQGTGTRSRPR